MEKSIEKLFNEMLNQILTDKQECKHVNDGEFKNDELISFYNLPIEHKDPFDRIMIWQSIKSDYYFLSVDTQVIKYKKYGLKILS